MSRDRRQIGPRLTAAPVTRRTVLRGGAALGLGAAVTARSGWGGARAQEKTPVRLATWAGVEEAAELQEVIDRVNQEATGFEIVSEPNPSDYYTKLQTTLAGGTSADLFWLSQEHVAGYADRGALLDISERLAEDVDYAVVR